ncbi:MAG: hypothetical protein ACK47B_01060 [Armatimonadota bacterium]
MMPRYSIEIDGMPLDAELETRREVVLGPDVTLLPNGGSSARSTPGAPDAPSGWMLELCGLEGDVVRVLIAEGESE